MLPTNSSFLRFSKGKILEKELSVYFCCHTYIYIYIYVYIRCSEHIAGTMGGHWGTFSRY